MYFWDFVWLENGIGDAAESCADIESEDKRTLIPAVRFPCVGRDGHRGRPRESVTEGKGKGREKRSNRKKVFKRKCTHTTRQIVPFPRLICGRGFGPLWCNLLPRTDGVHIPSFFHIAPLPAYSYLLITVRWARPFLPLHRHDASQS